MENYVKVLYHSALPRPIFCFHNVARPSEYYHFYGDVNISHLINDCIKDKRVSFVVVREHDALLGFTKQLLDFAEDFKHKYWDELTTFPLDAAFHVFTIEKAFIGTAITEMSKIPKLLKKQIRKTSKSIGKNRTKYKTKVIVF